MTSPPPIPTPRRQVTVRSLVFALIAAVVLTSGFWNSFYLWRKTPATPPGPALGMRVECPEKVKVGDSFEIKIVIRNAAKTTLEVGTLSIDDSFLQGMKVTSIDPRPYSQIEERWYVEYKFWQKIEAGKTNQYTFHVKASEPGIFKGDVDLYGKTRRITSVLGQITIE